MTPYTGGDGGGTCIVRSDGNVSDDYGNSVGFSYGRKRSPSTVDVNIDYFTRNVAPDGDVDNDFVTYSYGSKNRRARATSSLHGS